MTAISSSLSELLDYTMEKKDFFISKIDDRYSIHPLSKEDPLYNEKVTLTAEHLIRWSNALIEQWNGSTTPTTPLILRPELSVGFIAHDYVKSHYTHLGSDARIYENITLALLLRKRVNPFEIEEMKQSDPLHYIDFVLQNKLHYCNYNAGVFDTSRDLSVTVSGVSYPYRELTQVRNEDGEIIFSFKGRELFRTDLSYKLTKNFYICGQSGILELDGKKPLAAHILAPFAQVKGTGEYSLLVVTSVTNITRPVFQGSHAFLALQNPEGGIVCVGSFMRDGYKNPDKYVCIPQTKYALATTPISISREQGIQIEKRFEELFRTKPTFAFLHDNCTSFVANILEESGIELTSTYSLSQFSALQFASFLPSSVQFNTRKIIRNSPEWVRKLFYFLPPVYFINLIVALSYRIGQRIRNRGILPKQEINLVNTLFFPWRCTMDHPLRLRESQLRKGETIYTGRKNPEADLPEIIGYRDHGPRGRGLSQ